MNKSLADPKLNQSLSSLTDKGVFMTSFKVEEFKKKVDLLYRDYPKTTKWTEAM